MPITPPVEATAARREPLAMAVEQLRFGYVLRASGERVAFKPLRVFDDGSKTYLQMPASLRSDEAPVLFVIEADTGTPQLTNYRVRGDYYVVDRLFEHAQLRIGPHQAVDIERSAAALPWLNG